ncbi:MAG: hypothetical protein JWO60_831, partial [Frankiales bacterium]|nr:hypothetical protein [Frankiales bacterium]
MSITRTSLTGTAALATALLLSPAAPASAQTAAPVAGGFADAAGIVVDLTVLTAVPLPGVLGSTPLDPNTFARSSSSCPPQAAPAPQTLLDIPASPAATAKTVTADARTDCSKPSAVAFAQTEGATALVNAGVPLITADVIRAQANSDCTAAPNGEGSLFAGLSIAGTPVPLGPLGVPEPNTVIEVPGVAKVIVNEQHPTASGRGIVVNGVHVIGESPLLRGDLIISHAVSGVVCANGKGSEVAEGLQAPDITFDKQAAPSTARPGETVTYTATVENTSDAACDVLRFVDHLSPALELVSTRGAFGADAETPAPTRADGGQDVVVRPTDVVLAPGAKAVQTIVVKVKADAKPGTYYNTLELFCNAGGDFASGPLAPVTVPAAASPSAAPTTAA